MKNSLFNVLNAMGFLKYGSVIPRHVIHGILGIDMPSIGTASQFREIELAELSAIGIVRDKLLHMGMYIKAGVDSYRILLPSENITQVRSYLSQSARKNKRAVILTRATPEIDSEMRRNIEVRAAYRSSSRRIAGEN